MNKIKNVIILHGWALKVNPSWQKTIKAFKSLGYRVYFPRIPGLTGLALSKPWTLYDYSDWLAGYIKDESIGEVVLIGHSFGGSIAMQYCLDCQTKKGSFLPNGLVLINSAGIRKKNFRKKVFGIVGKSFKIFFVIYPICLVRDFFRPIFYKLIRSTDYLQTKGPLTKTLQNIISLDLSSRMKNIKVPTLIIWGAKDKDTPLYEGRFIAGEIAGSKLTVIKNASHGLPFQQPKKVASIINRFINSI